MARRRSRRRKKSYQDERESSGFPPQLVVEDLSPRARRLVEGGLIDLDTIHGSGDGGRISSGDILHAARVMEVEQSVARIEAVGRDEDRQEIPNGPASDPAGQFRSVSPVIEIPPSEEIPAEADAPAPTLIGEPPPVPVEQPPEVNELLTTTASAVGGEPVEVAPDPWNAYNGVSEGLAESALPGAEQSWGEAEANIAAIAEEAAAQVYGRPMPQDQQPIEAIEPSVAVEEAAGPEPQPAPPELVSEQVMPEPVADQSEPSVEDGERIPATPEVDAVEPESVEPELVEQPTAVVAALSDIEALLDPEPPAEATEDPGETEAGQVVDEPETEEPEAPVEREAMMDFGTLEMVDPESVWAEGAEDFAPWFLAHSRQLGDVLGLDAGLSDARQFTTKSATGVVGRDDTGEDVVVVSSQSAVADDSDLGRALGMAASSGAATVALVSAKFNDEQLAALAWLNNQTKSGVQWYGIEMRVVRIADSPAAMLFDLVASPPQPKDS